MLVALEEPEALLGEVLGQVVAERGPFKDITEEALRDEIAGARGQWAVEEPEEEDEETGDSRGASFLAARREIVQAVQMAHNECQLALDFVLLLVLGPRPTLGALTMLPHLRQHVPVGLLTADRVLGRIYGTERLQEVPEDAEEGVVRAPVAALAVGRGWKQTAVATAAERFRHAASRLLGEVASERNYWLAVEAVRTSTSGSLFRLREGGAREMGVRYGYGESGLSYTGDRGVAVLRKLDTGELEFQPVGGHRRVGGDGQLYRRVVVGVHTKVDGDWRPVWRLVPVATASGSLVAATMARAQFYLFEAELFDVLTAEAVGLAAHGVSTTLQGIFAEIGTVAVEISTEAVGADEAAGGEAAGGEVAGGKAPADESPADELLVFLRLLLCNHHAQARAAKQAPPGLRRPAAQPLLLRPLIGLVRHTAHVRRVRQMLESMYGAATVTASVGGGAFAAAETPPCSCVVAERGDVRVAVEVSGTASYCGLHARVTVQRGGSQLLDVGFSELGDVEECLRWAGGTAPGA